MTVEKNKILNKFFKPVPMGLTGFMAFIITVIGFMLAASYIPKFSIFNTMLSDLGNGEGGIFFNGALIISGLLALPFYFYLINLLNTHNLNRKLQALLIINCLLTITAYILLGFFPSIGINLFFEFIHGALTLICWLSGMIFYSSFSYLVLKYKELTRFHALIGFSASASLLIGVITWSPISEWIMTFFISLFILTNSLYLIIKHKKVRNRNNF